MRSLPVILAYHAVGDCPAANDPHNLFLDERSFEAQMSYLAAHKKVVPLAEAMSGSGHPAGVAITFDDGYRNVLSVAAPILRRYGFPATVFVPTGWLGLSNEWDEPSPCPFHIMTETELVELQEMGVSIESHGHAHIDMSASSREDVSADIERSLDRLESITGRRPRYLAYPYGLSSPDAQAAAAELGLDGALSIDSADMKKWTRGREQVTRRDGSLVFRMKCAGVYGPIRHSRVGDAVYSALRPMLRRLLVVRDRPTRS